MREFCISMCVFLLMLRGGTASPFHDGHKHFFTYHATSHVLGLHNLDTIIKFHVIPVNRTDDGSMNLLKLDSYVQHSDKGYVASNPKHWDLSRSFLFHVTGSGVVTRIFHHPDEEYEVLTIKKLLAGTMSLNKQTSHMDTWNYDGWETDHHGKLFHKYTGSREASGTTFTRTHNSSEHVQRFHEKTISYDHDGILKSVRSTDTIKLYNKAGSSNRMKKEKNVVIVGKENGEFPSISSTSDNSVKLTARRRIAVPTDETFTGLKSDSPESRMAQKKGQRLQEVEQEVARLMACVRSYTDKYNTNRTECSHHLTKMYNNLTREDRKLLAERHLPRCESGERVCSENRAMMLDLVCGVGDEESQRLVLKYVLQDKDSSDEDIHAVLYHYINMKRPIKESVDAVEQLCFQGNYQVAHTEELVENQMRACLTLGGMASSLSNNGEEALAEEVMEKVENKLGMYNHTLSKPIVSRQKRSIHEFDDEQHNHIITKMILLHSLGNAGMSRSLRHIRSYLEPNRGASAWRRAAANSLRYFKCNESALALFDVLAHDDNQPVYKEAREVYLKHPKRSELHHDKENILLSRQYDYPTVARVKREVKTELFSLEVLDGMGFRMQIRAPGLKKLKTIGTSNVGSQIGLNLENNLDIKLHPLNSWFRINVDNEAWTFADIGMINKQLEISRAKFCYIGHVGYNLNILKDFSIDHFKKLLDKLNEVIHKITHDVKEAVDLFKRITSPDFIRHLFDEMIKFVKNLPSLVKQFVLDFVQLVKKVLHYHADPVIEKVKVIGMRIKAFAEEVKQDALEFYHSIADAVMITLPNVGKMLKEAGGDIISVFKDFFRSPTQSFSKLEQVVIRVQLAVSMVIDAKNRIVDACFFTKGTTPFWMRLSDEVSVIINDIKDLIALVMRKVDNVLHPSAHRALPGPDNNGIMGPYDMKSWFHEETHTMLANVTGSMTSMKNSTESFFQTFHDIMSLVVDVKNGYETVKTVIHVGKSLIQRLFGGKFHKKFPSRLESVPGCTEGVWPSNGNDRFKTFGVDISISSSGQQIVNPVTGIVKISDHQELTILPTDSHFRKYVIILNNIAPYYNITQRGQRVTAGTPIGRPGHTGDCPTIIHLAMYVRHNSKAVDPSKYLHKRIPLPQWITNCNERSLTVLGKTFEAGGMSKNSKPEPDDYKSKRFVHMTSMTKITPDFSPLYQPAGMDSPGSRNLAKLFADQVSPLKNIGEMMTNLSSKIPKVQDFFDVNGMTVALLRAKLKLQPDLVKDLDGYVHDTAACLKEVPVVNPSGMSLFKLRMLTQFFKLNVTGDRLAMVNALRQNAMEGCPNLNSSVMFEFGHYCTAHTDCQGMACGAVFEYSQYRKTLQVDIRHCGREIVFTILNNTHTVLLLGGTESFVVIPPDSMMDGLYIKFTVHTAPVEDGVSLSVSGSLCASNYGTCLPPVGFIKDAEFNYTNCSKAEARDPFIDQIHKMSVRRLMSKVSQCHLDMTKALAMLNNIRNALLNQMFDASEGVVEKYQTEFEDKTDSCVRKLFPEKAREMTFFLIKIHFMVGPIPMVLEFGAGGRTGKQLGLDVCFMSMKLTGKLIPSAALKVWGELDIDIGIAFGGLRLTGYIMTIKFPITGTIGFAKFPLELEGKLDMELVPLQLVLDAFAKLRLLFFNVQVFKAPLWKYSMAAIRKNIKTLRNKGHDKSPPSFAKNAVSHRERRDTDGGGCEVKQLEGRDPSDTAFLLEVTAVDDASDVKTFYAIGTHSGGTDVVDWTEMGGNSLTMKTDLTNGVPLYWTVKAINSGGGEAVTECMLQTYDNTPPDGRVDDDFRISSNPFRLGGTVVVLDDSNVDPQQQIALGLSAGEHGSELDPWSQVQLEKTTEREEETTNLRFFSLPKTGRLTAEPIKSTTAQFDYVCATACKQFGQNCVSFDYDYNSRSCDFHDVGEGPSAQLRVDGSYKSFERLGVGQKHYKLYTNLNLTHGETYFINTHIKNELGYRSFLSSHGTLLDLTPPSSGPVGEALHDDVTADGCSASILQRCEHASNLPNHRKIIDGTGSNTVFNGGKRLNDVKYTLANNLIAGNWDGFHDNETGIYGYTWGAGASPCSDDVVKFNDPHANLPSKDDWTYSGLESGLMLQDGHYYVTVQAINNVVHGGALVTTVCHSQPLIVDTTPPDFRSINDLFFDEDFELLGLYYNGSDDLSKIHQVHFGLGRTKNDVNIRSYMEYHTHGDKPYILVEDFNLEPGQVAWPRLRLTNNVGLSTSGHAEQPLIVDNTAPVAGVVSDGNVDNTDLDYQADDRQICAQWQKFYDSESGIKSFMWGVGTRPGSDDVVSFRLEERSVHRACSSVQLHHNSTYYSTIIAYNTALNQKKTNTTSDGVLVDTTDPVTGWIKDGEDSTADVDYSAETALVQAVWGGFSDPESGIWKYEVDILINGELRKTNTIMGEPHQNVYTMNEKTLDLHQGDRVNSVIRGFNGARRQVTAKTDGFVIDLTPPVVYFVHDNPGDHQYQTDKTTLRLSWKFEDNESGMDKYQLKVMKDSLGMKTKIWPSSKPFEEIAAAGSQMSHTLTNLNLEDGARYFAHVVAFNKAKMSKSADSTGVRIDSSPPIMELVHIGPLKEDEEIENEKIIYTDNTKMTVSWRASDPDSGISQVFVALGIAPNDQSLSNGYLHVSGERKEVVLKDLDLKPSGPNGSYYYVQVKVENGAGIMSSILVSKPINVLQGNVPGVIFDGRKRFIDSDYSHDLSTFAMSFAGFQSIACGIVAYEWGIGTEPFVTDIVGYTSFGIVKTNQSSGFGQMNIQLFEGVKYFTTVRARTGHKCHEDYIVATSDGLIADTKGPTVKVVNAKGHLIPDIKSWGVIFQNETDIIEVKPQVTDPAGVNSTMVCLGTHPYSDDLHHCQTHREDTIKGLALKPGSSVFVTVKTRDNANNEATWESLPLIPDSTPPEMINLTCTGDVSVASTVITCSWDRVNEYESHLKSILLCVGEAGKPCNLISKEEVQIQKRSWSVDMYRVLKSTSASEIFITVHVVNSMNKEIIFTRTVAHDITPPLKGDILIVTNSLDKQPSENIPCQVTRSYVEVLVKDFKDKETGIHSCQVSLGTEPGTTNIHPFKVVDQNSTAFFGKLPLQTGDKVYATARCINRAGLSTSITSDPVAVSPHPVLTVLDGSKQQDEDYQTALTTLQGTWQYSEGCPVETVEWQILTVSWDIVQDFTPVDINDKRFYSDELHLSASVTYINVIKVTDALNRVRIAYSDGITVAIAPPHVGSVRDGLDDDVDYQTSTTELWVNWDRFGDSNSSDATQQIDRYEVAVGDDVRNPESRFNIKGFQSVQLKTSFTFTNLSLTPKTVTYYITVRAYSKAGSFQEATSDGIRVGFDLDIAPGIIDLHPYTNSFNKMTISWSKFYSDIGITKYSVGLSNEIISMPNETSSCDNIKALVSNLNITLLSSRNSLLILQNLTLEQGKQYYVIVIAHDKADSCISVTKGPTTVDVTPPKEGTIIIEGQESRVGQFVQDQDRLTIQWKGFDDRESGIHVFKISLFQSEPCKLETTRMIKTMDVRNSTVTTMYKLNLEVGYVFHVQVKAINNAGRNVSAQSSTFKVDTSPPLSGTVKIGSDWHDSLYFQNKEDSVKALTGFARNERGMSCKKMKQLFPKSENNEKWSEIEPGINEGTLVDDKYARIALTYDHTLTEVIAGGLYMALDEELKEGNFSFRMKSARGENIITSIHFHFGDMKEYRPPILVPLSEQEPSDAFMLEDSVPDGNESVSTNETNTADSCLPGPGIAVFFYGSPDGNMKWKARWCVQDDSKDSSEWFDLPGDPSDYLFETSIQLIQNIDGIKKSWKANLFYEDNIKVRVDGYTFSGHPTIMYHIDTIEGYKPPVGDPLHPFFAQAVLSHLAVPDTTDKDCLHGDPFYDHESGIKEIWMGISSNKSMEDNIVPYALKASYCMPCKSSCTEMCNSSCSLDDLPDFSVLKMQLDNLHLGHSEKGNMTDSNSSALMDFKAPTYYVNIKAVNFADQSTVSTSNAFQVDITPPVFRYIMCVDPTHSLDEPSDFVGSNNSVGAFWDCDEDVSEIAEYHVEIGSTEGGNDVLKATSVDLTKKVGLTLQDTTLTDGEVYYVTATVINAAGLTARSSCNVTVMLGGPGTSRMYSQAMFSSGYTKSTRISLTNAQDAIGLQIHGANNIFYYEWKTGTSPNKDDIFPTIQIATRSNPAELSIQKGQLWVDGKLSNISLSDYRNDTEEGEEDGSEEEVLLFLEPGRCVHHSLHAVGKSHLTSEIRTQPACIKRQKDVLIEVEPKEQQFNLTQETESSTSPHGSMVEVSVSVSGSNGSVIMGRLNATDTRRLYGSAATADFVSYITSPADTLTATSRLLYGRLVRPRGVEIFVGPAPEVYLTAATLTLHAALSTASGNKNELLLWNEDLEMWELPCISDDPSNFKICPKGVKDTVTDIHITKPQMFALFEIRKEVFNSAPVFITKSLTSEEDQKTTGFIEVYDKEDDSLSITIKDQSHHGHATLDDGYLTFEPEEDFCGQDKIVLQMKEENVPAGAQPHAVLQELLINVQCVDDPPELHFVSAQDDVFTAGVKDTVNIDIDSSQTSNQYMLGYFALSDNDASDQLELIFDSGAADGIDLVLTNSTSDEYLKHGHAKPLKAKTTAYYGVWIKNANNADQNKTIKFRVKDGHKMHSNPISLKVAMKKKVCTGSKCSAMTVVGVKENKAKKFEEKHENIVTPPPHLFQNNYLGTGHLSVETSNSSSSIIIMSTEGVFSKGQETSKANEGHQVFKVSGKLTISYQSLKGNNTQDIHTDNLLAKRLPIRVGIPFTISMEAKQMTTAHLDVKVLSRQNNLTHSHLLVKEQDGVYREVPRLCNNTRGGLFDDDQDILTMCPELFTALGQRISPNVDPLTLQVAIFSVKENQPPYLVDSVITMKERDQLYVKLKAKDPEGDKFIFKVTKNAEQGYADVDTTGNIFYTPSPHFSGEDRVNLQLQETSVLDGSLPKVVDTVLLIKVLPINDPPVLYYLPPHSGQFRIEDKAKVEVNIERFRPFTSSHVDLGVVAAADWDVGDSFNYKFIALNKTTHFFEVQEVTLPDSVWSYKLSDIRRLPEKKSSKILMNFTSEFEGTLLFDVTVKDVEGAGVELDLAVHVTIKQCNTGQACSDHVTANSDNA